MSSLRMDGLNPRGFTAALACQRCRLRRRAAAAHAAGCACCTKQNAPKSLGPHCRRCLEACAVAAGAEMHRHKWCGRTAGSALALMALTLPLLLRSAATSYPTPSNTGRQAACCISQM